MTFDAQILLARKCRHTCSLDQLDLLPQASLDAQQAQWVWRISRKNWRRRNRRTPRSTGSEIEKMIASTIDTTTVHTGIMTRTGMVSDVTSGIETVQMMRIVEKGAIRDIAADRQDERDESESTTTGTARMRATSQ